MDAFSKLHPAVIVIYYGMAVFLTVFYSHPLITGLVWGAAFVSYVSFAGAGKGCKRFFGSVGIALACLIINPLFNHRGVTVLFMLGDSRITKEAVLYGGNMALTLLAALFLFAGFSHYMTAEKIMTLAGGKFPSFSLLFSMILRFVPKAGKDCREMTHLHGNRPAVISALIGLSLEDSLERSLSMKSRGYGQGKRSSYYQKKMTYRDVAVLVFVVLMGIHGLFLYRQNGLEARFFPGVKISAVPFRDYIILGLFYSIPLIFRGKEEILWLLSRRRITDFSIRNRQSRH